MAKLSYTLTTHTSRDFTDANLIMTEGDYDIENNRSPINWRVTLTKHKMNTSWSGWGTKIYVTGSIGGQSIGTIYIPEFNYGGTGGSGTQFASGTIWITHDTDGTKKIDATIKFVDNADGNNSGSYYTPGDGSNSVTGLVLETIPRASTPSLGTATMNSVITIDTNRASSSFTHTLTYKFGSATGTIGTAKGVGASVDWTPPLSLADQVPNATSGTGTITCDTYNGSTHIGTKSISFKANVPTSVVPTISSVGLSDGNTVVTSKSIGYFVQNKSYGVLAVSSAGAYSSTIKTFKLTIAGTTYTENSIANINSKLASLVLPVGDSLSYSVVVTDSRGRTSSAKTGTYTVKAYSPPSITGATAYRSNSAGAADDDGTCINAQIAGSISTVGGKNKCTVKIGYKLKSNTTGDYTWTTYVSASTSTISVDYTGNNKKIIGAGGISANSTYLCQVYIADLWDSNTRTFEIPTGFDLIHYHKSGKSLAIGKKSEATDDEEKLEIALDTEYKGMPLLEYKVVSTSKKAIAFTGDVYLDSSCIRLESNNTLKTILPYGSRFIDLGQSLLSNPTNSFQTTIFGINADGRYKLACTRAGSGGQGPFSSYGCSIVASTSDTHMFITTDYWANNGRARIGAGNADKINWWYTIPREREVLWEGDLPGGNSITLTSWRRFLRIYVRINFGNADGTMMYEIDTTMDSPVYGGTTLTPFDENSMNSVYMSECEFNTNTGVLTHRRVGYYVFASHAWNDRNGRSNGYFVYRVETHD